jgi:hypothetical protein
MACKRGRGCERAKLQVSQPASGTPGSQARRSFKAVLNESPGPKRRERHPPESGRYEDAPPADSEIRDHRESDHEAARKKPELEPRAAPVKDSQTRRLLVVLVLLRQQPAWPRASSPGPTPTQAAWGRHRAGRVSRWGERPLEVRQRRSLEARHCDAGASFLLDSAPSPD